MRRTKNCDTCRACDFCGRRVWRTEKPMEETTRTNVKQRLIQNGIAEISAHGIRDFSVRRVATKSGVSCAAPYKHFKDRDSFIAAMLDYVTAIWIERLRKTAAQYPGDFRRQLVEISTEYVRFLVENPHYRSIIMLKDDNFDGSYRKMRAQMTDETQKIVHEYCESVHMPEDTMHRKLYVVRSLIYGAALMFDNGEMPYPEKAMGYVRYTIDREFDLP